jgi:hypothetical protein
LQGLYCSYCPFLSNISFIGSLRKLYCSHCHLLTSIPQINSLRQLDCSFSYRLTHHIPQINDLQKLDSRLCRSVTGSNITNINNLRTDGCVWLSNDPQFDESVKKLIKLQRWFKSMHLSRRLEKLIPLIVPIYYHPDAKGGYFDKQQILQYFEQL